MNLHLMYAKFLETDHAGCRTCGAPFNWYPVGDPVANEMAGFVKVEGMPTCNQGHNAVTIRVRIADARSEMGL